ncbi:hypothetical protein V8C26DRAFT_325002 [Trichoderma gracile]
MPASIGTLSSLVLALAPLALGCWRHSRSCRRLGEWHPWVYLIVGEPTRSALAPGIYGNTRIWASSNLIGPTNAAVANRNASRK